MDGNAAHEVSSSGGRSEGLLHFSPVIDSLKDHIQETRKAFPVYTNEIYDESPVKTVKTEQIDQKL